MRTISGKPPELFYLNGERKRSFHGSFDIGGQSGIKNMNQKAGRLDVGFRGDIRASSSGTSNSKAFNEAMVQTVHFDLPFRTCLTIKLGIGAAPASSEDQAVSRIFLGSG